MPLLERQHDGVVIESNQGRKSDLQVFHRSHLSRRIKGSWPAPVMQQPLRVGVESKGSAEGASRSQDAISGTYVAD